MRPTRLLCLLLAVVCCSGMSAAHAVEWSGVPISIAHWKAPNPSGGMAVVAITLEVNGKVAVAAAIGRQGNQYSAVHTEMISLIYAAIERKVPIKLNGTLTGSPPDVNYPNGRLAVYELEVLGHKFGRKYLTD